MSSADDLAIFLVLLVILSLVVLIISIILLAWNRNSQPIKFRSLIQLVLISIGLGAASIYSLLYLLHSVNSSRIPIGNIFCGYDQLIITATTLTITLPYILRFSRIYYILSRIKHTHSIKIVTESQLVACFLAVLLSILVLNFSLIYSAIDFVNLGYSFICSEIYSNDHSVATGVIHGEIWFCIQFLQFLFLLLILRYIYANKQLMARDEYYILQELQYIATVQCLFVIFVLIIELLHHNSIFNAIMPDCTAISAELYSNLYHSVYIARNYTVFYISIIMPLRMIYSENYAPIWGELNSINSVETLLADLVALSYFRCYLFSVKRDNYCAAWMKIQLYKHQYQNYLAVNTKKSNPENSSSSHNSQEDSNSDRSNVKDNTLADNGGISTPTGSSGTFYLDKFAAASSTSTGPAVPSGSDGENISQFLLSTANYNSLSDSGHYSVAIRLDSMQLLLRELANEIYEEYLQLGCENEIKELSANAIHVVIRELQGLQCTGINCFDYVEGELLALLQAEHEHFVASHYYEQCKQDLTVEEKLKTILQLTGLV
jgi:hypothetical protein